jgi:uncharacterized protein involved in exopolysaccharide biosynthesis
MPSKAKPEPDLAELDQEIFEEIRDELEAAAQEAQSHADRIAALEAQVASIKTVLGGMGQVVE